MASRVKLSIVQVFLVVSLLALIGVGTVSFMSATNLRNTMQQDRYDKVRHITEGMYGIIQSVIARQKSGELTEDQAKELVRETVKYYRYDNGNYFFMNTYDNCNFSHFRVERIGKCKDTKVRVQFTKVAKAGGGLDKFLSTVKPGIEGLGEYVKVAYIQPIDEWQMYIGTGVYMDDIDAAFQERLIELLIVGLLTVAVIAVVGVLIGRNASNTVKTLASRMEELAGGNTDVRFNFASLLKEVDAMVENVRVFREQLVENRKLEQEKLQMEEQARQDRRAATLKLADEFDQSVGEIVRSVSGSSQEMERTAKGMSEVATSSTSQAVTVAAAAEEASRNVSTVASASEELSASIEEIASQVQKASQTADAAVQESKDANDRMQGLSNAADKIGEVVTLITDIATQTNLLALNATIEAARAGEAGKGFAVVASEVKNLATQTGQATEEISQQIASIQNETNSSVEAIRSITGTITDINTISTAIAAAIEQQGVATQEISRSVQQASEGTNDVSRNIVMVKTSAEETGVAANDVQNAAGEMSVQATHLNDQVAKFLDGIRQE